MGEKTELSHHIEIVDKEEIGKTTYHFVDASGEERTLKTGQKVQIPDELRSHIHFLYELQNRIDHYRRQSVPVLLNGNMPEVTPASDELGWRLRQDIRALRIVELEIQRLIDEHFNCRLPATVTEDAELVVRPLKPGEDPNFTVYNLGREANYFETYGILANFGKQLGKVAYDEELEQRLKVRCVRWSVERKLLSMDRIRQVAQMWAPLCIGKVDETHLISIGVLALDDDSGDVIAFTISDVPSTCHAIKELKATWFNMYVIGPIDGRLSKETAQFTRDCTLTACRINSKRELDDRCLYLGKSKVGEGKIGVLPNKDYGTVTANIAPPARFYDALQEAAEAD